MPRMKSTRQFRMGRLILFCCLGITAGADLNAQLPSTLSLPDGTVASGNYWYAQPLRLLPETA
jgi:hypothetical protein